MRILRTTAFAAALALAAPPAFAVQPEEVLADAALEARARAISKELRCVVCRNQSIDDSDAEVAGDMRKFVRARLVAGESDDQIRAQLVEYYGEYVLLRPRFSGSTLVLWLAPALMLGLGGWLAWRRLGGAPAAPGPEAAALSADEQARLDAILKRDG